MMMKPSCWKFELSWKKSNESSLNHLDHRYGCLEFLHEFDTDGEVREEIEEILRTMKYCPILAPSMLTSCLFSRSDCAGFDREKSGDLLFINQRFQSPVCCLDK